MPTVLDPTIVEEAAADSSQIDELLETDGQIELAEAEAAPDEVGEAVEPEEAAPALRARRAIPVPVLRRRAARGRYSSRGAAWRLELRIDVDGSRPTNRVSGDFFSTSGHTTRYFGSFAVHAPAITRTPTEIRIEGLGSFTWAAGAPKVRVTVPRVMVFQAPQPATIQFLTQSGSPGAKYLCAFDSPYFRTIQWEQDSVAGAVPFIEYDTGSLPQPPSSPPRKLTVVKAFAEAGLEIVPSGTPNVIPPAGAGATWSDSELHNAMENHFSLFADAPQWRLWLLVATAHDGGYRGIMFDYADSFQRQGAAVFYDAIKGDDAASQRAALRTYVHELGHAFNLLHSWQKNLADPPAPLGPNGGLGDLSWMNYAWKYQPPAPAPGGEGAYWANFPFQFTDNELVHLRHGFYKDVIPGANKFGKGAADIAAELFDDPIEDNSGLGLELRARDAFDYGEPVVVEMKLKALDLRGRDTHGYLHPNDDFVGLAIKQPSGAIRLFRPMLRRCADEDRRIRLDPGQPAIYDSAYVGFGQDGFYFDQPGRYELRAQYVAADGSRIVSPVLTLRVRPPATREDERAAELLLGEEQGKILALLGSDSQWLRHGNEALDTLIEEHADHPLATYARLAKGINCERDFKDLTADKRMHVRAPQPEASVELLSKVTEASVAEGGVDNVTLNMVMRRQARAQASMGNIEKAEKVMDAMVSVFEAKKLNPHVLQKVRDQAEATKRSILADAGRLRAVKAGDKRGAPVKER